MQIFNAGAVRMLGYQAADVVNRITPADISDPPELIARAAVLSLELAPRHARFRSAGIQGLAWSEARRQIAA